MKDYKAIIEKELIELKLNDLHLDERLIKVIGRLTDKLIEAYKTIDELKLNQTDNFYKDDKGIWQNIMEE